jgi:hypothetical protein
MCQREDIWGIDDTGMGRKAVYILQDSESARDSDYSWDKGRWEGGEKETRRPETRCRPFYLASLQLE